MSTFQIGVLIGLVMIAGFLYCITVALDNVAKELKEIWRRMKRLD